MISRPSRALDIIAAIALILANVVAFNVLFGKVRGARVDLTEDRIYTLAPETLEIIQEPEEPLEIFFYHTALDRMHEKLRPLVGPLGDILKEFEAASNGHITTRLVEWDSADKATQDRATDAFGVKPLPIQMQTSDEETVRNTYFSVVVSYGDQYQRFDQSDLYRIVQVGAGLDIKVELQNIEFILAKAIYKVVRGFQSIGAALATNDITARVELYFSPTEAMPKFLEKVPGYAAKVTKKLADESMGRLKVETKTVSEKPEDERVRAQLRAQYGLRPIRTDLLSETGIYSWAVLTAGGHTSAFPLATLGEEMTEFDVRDAVEGQLKALIPGFLVTVGVMTPDASRNPMSQMMGQRQPPEEFREVVAALEAEFDIRRIDLSEGKPVPRQIAVLVIVRPESMSEKAIYEIDQFLMRGGRLVVCADAFSFDLEAAMQFRETNKIKRVDFDGFRRFLRHLGADVGDSMILDTKSTVVQMMRSGGRRREPEFGEVKSPYFVYLETPDGFDRKNDIVAKQRFLLMPWATPVTAAKAGPAADGKEALPGVPEGVTVREFAWTSPESSTSDSEEQAEALGEATPDYKPPTDAKRHPVALVLSGTFPSYFAGKPIPGEEPKPGAESAASRPETRERGFKLDRSKDTSVVVIGDSDFLSPIVAQAFDILPTLRPNLALLRNAIDFGGPEARLMAIRNRETVQRPLTALHSMNEDQRQEKAGLSRMLALAIPCAAVLFLGVGWALFRRSRKPLELPATRAAS